MSKNGFFKMRSSGLISSNTFYIQGRQTGKKSLFYDYINQQRHEVEITKKIRLKIKHIAAIEEHQWTTFTPMGDDNGYRILNITFNHKGNYKTLSSHELKKEYIQDDYKYVITNFNKINKKILKLINNSKDSDSFKLGRELLLNLIRDEKNKRGIQRNF